MRYRQNVGQYPQKLNELVTAEYLKQLPMDPFSDRPLVYKKRDDNFLLYSVGRNFTDDDGEFGKDKKGKIKVWADEGDAVFWPAHPIVNNIIENLPIENIVLWLDLGPGEIQYHNIKQWSIIPG